MNKKPRGYLNQSLARLEMVMGQTDALYFDYHVSATHRRKPAEGSERLIGTLLAQSTNRLQAGWYHVGKARPSVLIARAGRGLVAWQS